MDVRANRARSLTTRTSSGMRVVDLADGKVTRIELPKDLDASNPQWSPDGKRIVFMGHTDDATHLYIADSDTGKVRRLTKRPMLATLVTGFDWVRDGQAIVAVLIPEHRAKLPERPAVAVYPRVRVADDKTTSLRTYPSLLDGPADEALLEYYATGQLAVVSCDSGRVEEIGKPAMLESVGPAPAGNYFRVTLLERPFSYIQPSGSFPRREVIWDANGEVKVEVSKRNSETPTDGANQPPREPAKRALAWRPDGAGLSYLEYTPSPAAPASPATPKTEEQGRRRGGAGAPSPTASAPNRKDRVMLWSPPFGKDDGKLVYEADSAIGSVSYSADCKTLFLTQTLAGKTRLSVVALGQADAKPVVLAEYAPDDIYASPGDLLTKAGPKTGSVVRISADGKSVYFAGTTYSKKPLEEGPRPFVDRVELATAKKMRVFEGKADVFEQPTVLDDDATRLLVTRQSATTYPNTFLLESGKERQVTQNKDYLPDISQARRETVSITRADGFKFDVRVWTPRYAVDPRNMPAMFWFYPSEVTDQATFDKGKRTFNKNLYPRVGAGSIQLFLRAGYVVVEPECPIVGPEGRMNDQYVPQLRNNLSATIDELDRRQMLDRRKLAIGGHSYGAFSTANAMVHTPFFKAGIAGDGNYNRSLTPFGFQSEGRQLWDNRGLYIEMSPLLFAERMTGALLLYHGMDDQNVGTDPINAPKMFAALEALGKPAAMIVYPYEDHGQIALETRLDLWARWIAWLEKYVKNAGKP